MTEDHRRREVERLRRLARWLDDRFRIPGTDIRFGLDALLGLLPGVGDTITAVWGAYFIGRAHRMNAPAGLKARMAGNVILDLVIGSIPLLGDIFDVGFKSNTRNVALLDAHLARQDRKGRRR